MAVLSVTLNSGDAVRVLAKQVEENGGQLSAGSKSKYLLALFDPAVEVDDLEVALGAAADGDASVQSRGVLEGEDGPSGSPLAFAYFAFDSAKAAKKVLALPPCTAAGPGGGLRGWLSALDSQKIDSRVLQAAVDAETAQFDKKQAEVAAAREQLAAAEGASGFTLVTKGRRNRVETAAVVEAGGIATGGMAAWESDNQKQKKKRGSLIMQDFYSFQKAEAKLDKLSELRRRFEEDKERINKLRATRTFKPY